VFLNFLFVVCTSHVLSVKVIIDRCWLVLVGVGCVLVDMFVVHRCVMLYAWYLLFVS
jgi:hypothetical protein